MRNPMGLMISLALAIGFGSYLLFAGGKDPEPPGDDGRDPMAEVEAGGMDTGAGDPPAKAAGEASGDGVEERAPRPDPDAAPAPGTPPDTPEPAGEEAAPDPETPKRLADVVVPTVKWESAKLSQIIADIKSLTGVDIKTRGAIGDKVETASSTLMLDGVEMSTLMTLLSTQLGVAWTERDGAIWLHAPDDPPPER